MSFTHRKENPYTHEAEYTRRSKLVVAQLVLLTISIFMCGVVVGILLISTTTHKTTTQTITRYRTVTSYKTVPVKPTVTCQILTEVYETPGTRVLLQCSDGTVKVKTL